VAHQPGAKVVMRWVPGNKHADEEAKKAVRGTSSDRHIIPIECRGTIPNIKTTELQRFQNISRAEQKQPLLSPQEHTLHTKLTPQCLPQYPLNSA
jgi:hypothetical protein